MPVEPVKEKKSAEKTSGNKIRLADTVRAVPNDLTRGILANGAQKIALRLRDTGQREQRNDYGGDQIEDAARSGAYLAARSADAVIRGGIRNILRGRRSEAPPPDDMPPLRDPPPMYDAPEFLPELDESQSAIGELPPAESPALPEHPTTLGETPVQETFGLPERSEIPSEAENASHPERTAFSGETQVPTEKSAPFSENPTAPEPFSNRPETGSEVIVTTEPSVSKTQSEAADRSPNRRVSHAEPETILTESKEENRRPAYRDAEPPRRVSAENGADAAKESGERIKVKNSDSVLTQKPERGIETPDAGRDSAISGRRVSVKEKNVMAVAERSQNIETGERTAIHEKSRTEFVRLTENRVPENPLSVREKSRTFPDAVKSERGNGQRVPHMRGGDGQSVPRRREQSAGRIPDTKPANAELSERNGLSAPSENEKIRIKTGDVSEYQSEFPVRPFQDVENYVQNVESDGQIGVRERIEKIRTTENRPSGNAWNRETAIRDGNGSERTPVKTKDTPGYRAGTSEAETPVQTGENRISRGEAPVPEKVPQMAEAPKSVTWGKEKIIRERAIQIAERHPDSGHAVRENSAQIRTNAPEIKESATITQEKREPTPPAFARIQEESPQPETPLSVGESPRIATGDGENLTRKPSETIRTAQTENSLDLRIRTKSPVAETLPRTSPQKTTPIKMREADIRLKDSPGTGITPRNSVQGGQKAVRERVEEIGGGQPIFQTAKPEAIPPRQSKTPRPDSLVTTNRKEKSVLLIEQKREPPTVKIKSMETRDYTPPDIPAQTAESTPVKTKETHFHQRGTPSSNETQPVTLNRDGKDAIRTQNATNNGVRQETDAGQSTVKTRDAHITNVKPPSEEIPLRSNGTAAPDTPKELRKTVRTRTGLIENPKPSAKETASKTNAPNGKSVALARTAEQAESVPTPATERVSNEKPLQQTPDIKTRNAYAKWENAVPESPDSSVESGERKFIRERKSKADLKRLSKRRSGVHSEPSSGDAAARKIEKLSAPVSEEGVKTKNAWLRKLGLDRPKERIQTDMSDGKNVMGKASGRTADGLPSVKTSNGGRDTLPALPNAESSPKGIKTRNNATRLIREKGTAAGKTLRDSVSTSGKVIKTGKPTAVKTAGKTVKTSGKTAEKAVKTTEQSVRNAQKTAQVAMKTNAVRTAAVRAAEQGAGTIRHAGQALVETGKAAVAALQSVIAALSAGGIVIVIILIIICLIGLLIATPFGLLFAGESDESRESVREALTTLAVEYRENLTRIQEENTYDNLDMAEDIFSAVTDNWRNVLIVYAARVAGDEASGAEVVTMNDEKEEILRETFWDMTQIFFDTDSGGSDGDGESGEDGGGDDSGGVTLHISVTVRDAEEMADEYDFDETREEFVRELLDSDYDVFFETLLENAQTFFYAYI